MTEVVLKGDGERPPKRSLVDTVNDRLRVNNTEESQWSLDDIAGAMDISPLDLRTWLEKDGQLKNGLEQFKDAQDEGVFKKFGNRADVLNVALLLNEIRSKHKK
jgi:hypothetical protein